MTENVSSEAIKATSNQLVSSLADLQDTLSMIVETDPRLSRDPGAVALRESAERLINFSYLRSSLTHADLRFVRDRDKKKLLPGQHPGLHLIFTETTEHKTLDINFYGGLRVVSSTDYHDGDPTLVHSHSKTTDKVLEQPVDFNWQLSGPRQSVDCWVRLNQHGSMFKKPSFQQGALVMDGETYDIHPTLSEGSSNFSNIRASLSSAIRDLTKMIPIR